ncbi:MAG: hypothetical protein M3178_02570 [Pseudomonadota bacterium]|nr:hypothetical protein [Pseudomonadota bacterium]
MIFPKTELWGESLAKPIDLSREPKKYDWLKPWFERLYIFNTFVADSALGVAVFAATHFAEIGLRNLDVASCPDLGHPGLADIIHYVGMAVVVCIIGHFSFSLVRNMLKDET